MAKRPEVIEWNPDLGITWTVEPDTDGRYAFLTLRDTKGRLVTIPGSDGAWNEAYVHMNRINCQMLADHLNSLWEENVVLKANIVNDKIIPALEAYQAANRLHNDSDSELWEQGELALGRDLP